MSDRKLEHITKFTNGFDCIKFECVNDSDRCVPGEGGSHGIGGLEVRFVSKGEEGAVQFLFCTGLTPKRISPDEIGYRRLYTMEARVFPVDLGCHSKIPQYGDHSVTEESCEYCDEKPCYYDGSGPNANDAMYALLNGGDEALWKFLDEYYECVFHGAEYPTPAEYPKQLRETNRA